MEVKTALITAARRLCFEKAPQLLPADFDPQVFHVGESIAEHGSLDLDSDALEWVLVALESVDVGRFSTFDELQSHLVWAIRDASRRYVEFWDTRLNDDTRSVLDSLCQYITGLSTEAVNNVKPLPYRRPLDEPEVRAVWHRVSERWSLPSTPPASFNEASWRPSHPDILVCDVDTFNRAVPPRVLRSILEGLGVRRLWKLDLPEERWSFEMDLAFVDMWCEWGECYWVAQDFDWIVYVSHEAELVVAGTAFLQRIRAAWSR